MISVPVHVFRGFTNIGEEPGFLFFVLGRDDPGRVTWAPKVFEMAKDYGLMLAEDGSLVDTTAGERLPAGLSAMAPTTAADVARLRVLTPQEAEAVVVHEQGVDEPGERLLIGPGAPLDWPHGFTLSHLALAEGAATPPGRRAEPEVAFVQSGRIQALWDGGVVELEAGDTVTVPTGAVRCLRALDGPAKVFLVRGGDRVSPSAPV